MFETISSKDNKVIKEIRKLKEKKYRTENNKFLVEGFRFAGEAVDSDFEVSHIFFSENVEEKFQHFKDQHKVGENTKIFKAAEAIIKTISSTENPQGIVAVVENKKFPVDFQHGIYIFVDKVQDPGNMGTIIRTANAAGAKGIIINKGSVDVYNDKTLRSTMGSIFKIPVIIDDDLSVLTKLKENSFKLIVSSLDTNKNFYAADLRHKVIIAVGNEGSGISDEILKLADEIVKIPMPGNAESLNVAVAAAIMMFEAVRQRTV